MISDLEQPRPAATQPQTLLGHTIGGKWVLHGVLGSGGNATVYAAAHSATNRKAAVKVLHRWVADANPNAGERFLRESRAASGIGHSAIPEVIDAGTHDDGACFIVFEWLEGKNMEEALRDGSLECARLIAAMRDVLDALQAAHDADIIHRDLKPANVFLMDDGPVVAKLLDFGAARIDKPSSASLTAQGTLIGTIDYMSPEQAQGKKVDHRSDVFSVGATLFRAFTGNPPYHGGTPLELLHRVATEAPPPVGLVRPSLPAPLSAVVDRALDMDPEKRWQSPTEMREALEALDPATFENVILPKVRTVTPLALAHSSEQRTEAAPIPKVGDFEGSAVTELSVPEAELPWLTDRAGSGPDSEFATFPPPTAPPTVESRGGGLFWVLLAGLLLFLSVVAILVVSGQPSEGPPKRISIETAPPPPSIPVRPPPARSPPQRKIPTVAEEPRKKEARPIRPKRRRPSAKKRERKAKPPPVLNIRLD